MSGHIFFHQTKEAKVTDDRLIIIDNPLRKHAYSNILKIFQPKKMKIFR